MSCTIVCAEVEELIADHAAGTLLWIERLRLWAHLLTCRRCRSRVGAVDARGVTFGAHAALTPQRGDRRDVPGCESPPRSN